MHVFNSAVWSTYIEFKYVNNYCSRLDVYQGGRF